jgi:predicted NUDIX family NTP pyrophosphohydrolase
MTKVNPKISAGILLYRFTNKVLEVLIVHPGGPFYKNKDLGVWDIPKGEVETGENLLETAFREFFEEVGFEPDSSNLLDLGSVKNSSGKIVYIWGVEGDLPQDFILKSNQIEINWPPKSEQKIVIPEVDQAVFTSITLAKQKVWAYQKPILDTLIEKLNYSEPDAEGSNFTLF